MSYDIRLASRADVAAIEEVMRRSLEVIGRTAYDDVQVASTSRHTARVDLQMIDDGTYFVAVIDDRIAGCGGWSRRAKLFRGSTAQEADAQLRLIDPNTEAARIRAMFVDPDFARRGIGRAILERSEEAARAEGFQQAVLVALLSGQALYEACGYRAVESLSFDTPDGVAIEGTLMEKAL
ncbi:MAG TPA: GNAT family N-acetyltransferase [Thermoanaerobaculia bacterium]|nr:GNAT family N-acetyltransferase [Thermoanaerobaculia bacterium]